MNRRAAALALLAAAASAAPGAAAGEDRAKDAEVAFVAPESGPESVASAEVRSGVLAAFGSGTVEDARHILRPHALPADARGIDVLAASLRKAAPTAVLAYAPDGRTADVERLAEKSGLPTIVLSPEPTRISLDPRRAVFWAGGVRPPDEALQAMDFLLLPLGSRRPAILHDASARAADAAARCRALHHVSQEPLPAEQVGEAFDAAAAERLVAAGADGFVYFGGLAGAERVLAAVGGLKPPLPVLLGQGLASGAVPTFASGGAKTAWAIDVAWFPDHAELAKDDRAILADAAKAAGTPTFGTTVRGYRAGRHVMDAVRAGGPEGKGFVAALRALGHPGARGRPVFEPWGHASLGRLVAWRSPAERGEPACRRLRATEVPMAGIPQIGTFRPSRFAWEEDTLYVHCSFGEEPQRSIEKDLQVLGLHTGGYETSLEGAVLDDLMGRFLSRMNRLFLRNPDGTSIPGLSWRISFTAEPPPKGVKSQKLYVVIAGDDPAAGGRASGNLAMVYSTFLQRTMYADKALQPALGATDRPFLAGTYRWATSLEQNLRCDTVRALLDGYSQAMALTGAHEVGHLLGPNHDTDSPRSIMNVVDAVGLDFEWAEWIPAHVKMLDSRLGRVPSRN